MSTEICRRNATEVARFVERDNYYLQAQPAFEAHAFVSERQAAFDPHAPTGFTPLDNREGLKCDWAATTPVMLARYMKLRKGDDLCSSFTAAGEIYYVIAGTGISRNRSDAITWRAGDIFCFPGGSRTSHRAEEEDSLLWVVTDEPLQAFLGVQARNAAAEDDSALHYPAAAVREALEGAQRREVAKGSASNGNAAFIFSSEAGMSKRRLPFPAMMLALNSLGSGTAQRPHRHNAAALTLVLEGEACYSRINGIRHDWQPFSAIVTPPGQLHSHHNEGPGLARVLITQDSGVHYYLRSAGFSYE
jgi:gentisate 1,2-dioxygenase